jgi:hypothetical protein
MNRLFVTVRDISCPRQDHAYRHDPAETKLALGKAKEECDARSRTKWHISNTCRLRILLTVLSLGCVNDYAQTPACGRRFAHLYLG